MLGIKNGMVMQRGKDNKCEVYLSDVKSVKSVLYSSENGELLPAKVTEIDGLWKIGGIPVGGPYTVVVDGLKFSGIYVGDVWVLAGQSNMEGAGYLTDNDIAYKGIESIRMFRMNDEWAVANHPLHEVYLAVDDIHKVLSPDAAVCPQKVGPGLAFMRKMQVLTGVPQGAICCAHGGTSMAQWSPELKGKGSGSLYGATLRRFNANGRNIRGMFWYQGCSDANDVDCELFVDNMINLVRSFREDFGYEFPIVQVQISRFTQPTLNPDAYRSWNAIQEHQRTLDEHISNLSTIATIIYPLDDCIHISGEGQVGIGAQGAEAMYHLIYGTDENGCLAPPKLAGYSLVNNEKNGRIAVEVFYSNLHGNLVSKGVPSGFTIKNPDIPTSQYVYKTVLREKSVLLCTDLTLEQISGLEMFYGYGTLPYCNITDELGRPIPVTVFGKIGN